MNRSIHRDKPASRSGDGPAYQQYQELEKLEQFNSLQQSTTAFLVEGAMFLVLFLLPSFFVRILNFEAHEYSSDEVILIMVNWVINLFLIIVDVLLMITSILERCEKRYLANRMESRSFGVHKIYAVDVEEGPPDCRSTVGATTSSEIQHASRSSCCSSGIFSRLRRFLSCWKPLLMDCFFIGTCLFFSLQWIIKLKIGPCSSDSQVQNNRYCNPSVIAWNGADALPLDSVLALTLIPTACSIVVRITRWQVALAAWSITVGTFLISLFWVEPPQTLFYAFIYGVTGFAVYYESHRQNLVAYSLLQRLQFTLQENERLADQSHANELRAMVGNVAHDLKTPLTSFMSGVDLLEQLLEDSEERLNESALGRSIVYEQITPMRNCLSNIQNTNSFMIMTINRCIDYTKASKGMKLVPKPETVDFLETLDLPLRVMRNLQQRLEIKLDETGVRSMCSHIITDKQWLQENVLCLLSNAVKYSARGTVDINISLVPRHQVSKMRASSPQRPQQQQLIEASSSMEASSQDTDRIKQPAIGGTRDNAKQRRDLIKVPATATIATESAVGAAAAASLSTSISEKHSSNEAIVGYRQGQGQEEDLALSLSERGLLILIEIQDTGIGLSEAAMENLFNPFKQAQRLAGGTGLGLYSLAKRLEALGGYYGVRRRDDEQQGSVFWFAFAYRPDEVSSSMSRIRRSSMISSSPATSPTALAIDAIEKDQRSAVKRPDHRQRGSDALAADRAGAEAINSEERSKRPPPLKLNAHLQPLVSDATNPISPAVQRILDQHNITERLDILLADDSISILKMTSVILQRHGHTVTQAENGADALEKMLQREQQNRAFNFVLMDLQMPVMDGLEAVRRLRANEKTFEAQHPRPGQPYHHVVIGCSANSDEETRKEAFDAGIDAFMSKPFSLETFYTLLGKIRNGDPDLTA